MEDDSEQGLFSFIKSLIKKKSDLENAAEWASQIDGILGGVVIVNDAMATWGDIELVKL